jgi:proteasome assembly chaperone (PAC2) family protein
MWTRLDNGTPPKLKDPVMIVAVSTSIQQYRALYSQAKELAKYMMQKLDFEKISTIYSSSFGAEVVIRDDGTATLPSCSMYVHRGKRDIILFTGDSSPRDDQFEFSSYLLNYAKEYRVKELYSIGARWSENPVSAFDEPEINGFASDDSGAKRLEKQGVKLIRAEPAPFFASIVVGMSGLYGIQGYKISVDHGEPLPHARSILKMLEILSEMIGFEIDLVELRSRIPPPQAKPSFGEGGVYQ